MEVTLPFHLALGGQRDETMTNVLSLTLFICGTRFAAPVSVAAGRASPRPGEALRRRVRAVPITVALVRTVNGNVLFDTGLDAAHLADPVLREALFTDRGMVRPPVVDAADDLRAVLAAEGLQLGDIDLAVLSHLHLDRTGGLKHLPRAPILVGGAELDAARGERVATRGSAGSIGTGRGVEGGDSAYLPADLDLPAARFERRSGDGEIDDGLTVLATPGVTAGHQSLIVTLPRGGPVILAGAALDRLADAGTGTPPAAARDPDAAAASVRRIATLSAVTGAGIVAGEDAAQMDTLAGRTLT
ncbi:Beta-lactamase-like protein [Stappia sp. 22II-S9-Z10]|nr:Beta-lactamase-like protein [Stappia sp. 22II-S9-Z10]